MKDCSKGQRALAFFRPIWVDIDCEWLIKVFGQIAFKPEIMTDFEHIKTEPAEGLIIQIIPHYLFR